MPHDHTMQQYSLERLIFVKFSQLIVKENCKVVSSRCQTLRLKCIKLYFGCSSAPDPTEELTVLPQISYLDLKKPTSKGKRGGKNEGEKSPLLLTGDLRQWSHSIVTKLTFYGYFSADWHMLMPMSSVWNSYFTIRK